MKNNFSKSFKSGFTLIELLVVVAIIGILAAVVLASLNSARSKGNDAAVKADLDDMRTQAAIYYDNTLGGNQTYGTASGLVSVIGSSACPTIGGSAGKMLYDDRTFCSGMVAAATVSSGTLLYNATTTGWIAGAPLQNIAGWWCVDGNGKSESVLTSNVAISSGVTALIINCP